jgi:hypothetical protein
MAPDAYVPLTVVAVTWSLSVGATVARALLARTPRQRADAMKVLTVLLPARRQRHDDEWSTTGIDGRIASQSTSTGKDSRP